jgi:Fungal protein kinase
MREQPWHRFILAYSICADDLHAHYFDRSGLIISLPTPIHKFPICVTEAVATTALADPQYLGLDPTIHMCIPDCQGTHPSLAVGAKGWVINNSGKTYSIMDTLWKSQGFFCRGTVCYRVRDPTNPDRKDYAMKDCWVPEAKRYHEVDVLERVKGIPNVVELVDHWDVMYDGEPDCTVRIRNCYQQFDPEDRDDHRFCNRFHRRIVMTPCGEPLSDFSSRKELICAFRDFVVGEFSSVQHVKFKCNNVMILAHRLMVERGILHGDLSPNNFIIYEGIGYFIDFDHAGFIEKGKASTISFGTVRISSLLFSLRLLILFY